VNKIYLLHAVKAMSLVRQSLAGCLLWRSRFSS